MSTSSNPSRDAPGFVFCDQTTDLPAVIQSLQGSPTLFLDCEGSDLGVKTGRLSLISLGIPATMPEEQRVYLIDAQTLGTSGLRPIFEFLESSDIRKVVFDGRMDQSALFHEHHVTLQNVVDLQLADITSRPLRGETEGSTKQIDRLPPYLPFNEVQGKRWLYGKVHKLAGLGQALTEHTVDVSESQLALKTTSQAMHEDWERRPLSRSHLAYAANDIYLISRLWSHFVPAGYLGANIPEQSLRYVRMWVNAQPDEGDAYKLHALLPLAILDAPMGATKQCSGCERLLPQPSFSKTAWNKNAGRKCLVCRAINIRELRKKQIREAMEESDSDDYAGYYDSDSDYFGGYGSD
ncbi:ribonuclease H-like domain-containing protein [Mycena latifolia]|nr:ribonuclease H-like domain-containing protein [Mycena latifolia]